LSATFRNTGGRRLDGTKLNVMVDMVEKKRNSLGTEEKAAREILKQSLLTHELLLIYMELMRASPEFVITYFFPLSLFL